MNRQVYKHLLVTYGRNSLQWVGFVLAVVNICVVRVYTVILAAHITSDVAAGNFAGAKRQTLYFLLAYVAGSLLYTAAELVSLAAECKQYERMMWWFYRKLINKDMSFYRDHQTGYLATVFRQYLDSGLLLVRLMRGEVLGVIISLTVPSIVLLFVAPKVGLVSVTVVLVQVCYMFWASAKANYQRRISNELYRKITGEVADEITNIVAFKSGGIEREAESRVDALTEQETAAFWLRRKTIVLLDLPRGIITTVGISVAVYIVISGAQRDAATLGLIVLTLTYMFQILRNVGVLPELISNHDDFVSKIYPTLSYLGDADETITDPAKPQKLKISEGTIDIRGIEFSYPAHADKKRRVVVFRDLTIHIAGGEQVGIVGLSGAGKSTLANLLLRFDDVVAGSICVDGVDIRAIRQADLRKAIAYVPQEPLLFHRTVRENIAYFNNAASEADIITAAKAAHADDFIRKLPDGYETMVGERGVKLSGGQKQRIAIARAVLKKAPIMVFDEATSALDSESEQIIQRALPEILGKQTAIIVAHRLSTVAGLDRIIVLHAGEIAEQGTHDELLALKGRYYSLWQKQTNQE
jgi:ATP-binding cassette, subfamily B, bacterial